MPAGCFFVGHGTGGIFFDVETDFRFGLLGRRRQERTELLVDVAESGVVDEQGFVNFRQLRHASPVTLGVTNGRKRGILHKSQRRKRSGPEKRRRHCAARAGLLAEQALTTEDFVSFVSFCLKTLHRWNPAFQTGLLLPLAACQRPAPSGNLAP